MFETAYDSQITDDVIDVFFVGDFDISLPGIATSPEWDDSPNTTRDNLVESGDSAYIIMAPNILKNPDEIHKLLAHEIGHMITNLDDPKPQNGDPPAPKFIFFPTRSSLLDSDYGLARRISADTEQQARNSHYLKPLNE